MRVFLLFAALLLFYFSPASAQNHLAPSSTNHGASVVVTSASALPVPTYGAKTITVKYVNRFRFDINPLTASTAIAAAVPPALLAPSAGSAKPTPSPTPTGPPFAPTPPPPDKKHGDPLADCSQSNPGAAIQQPPVKPEDRVAACWVEIRSVVADSSEKLLILRQTINDVIIRNAVAEQACYIRKTKSFSQVLLSHADAMALLLFASANSSPGTISGATNVGCSVDNATEWPFRDADSAEQDLSQAQNALVALASAAGYSSWIGPNNSPNYTANAALDNQIKALLIEARSYGKGTAGTGIDPVVAQSYIQFQAVVQTNLQWRDRLTKITAAASVSDPSNPDLNEQLRQEIAVNSCNEWYGRGRTDVISIHAVDVTPSAPAVPDIKIVTNTCTPLSILSTGLGVTFLPSPVYGFVPDATGAQIIGKTAVNDKSILYALLYNVHIKTFGKNSGVELFASPGVGLTSASSTTTTDWLGGLSLSFARRLIFLTGSADFGNRTELLPGFSEGAPKGALSSVPTRTNMKAGAMISISFGIAP